MKYLLSIILLTQVLQLSALSFREVPLNRMIDEAQFICRGKIIQLQKTDSLLQQQLRNSINKSNEKGKATCGWCDEIATFVVNKSIKGQLQNDTIYITFHRNAMFALPGFKEYQEYILFLNELKGFGIYAKTDPRFGVKSSNLNEYETLITEYQSLVYTEEKRKWILDLCINPRLSWEGMLNFSTYSPNQFSEPEKEFLSKGLIDMEFNNDPYLRLLDLVPRFGRNDELLKKCFDRLELIKSENVYEGLDLMQAIDEMDPKEEFKVLIDQFFDGFNNKFTDSQKLELVKEFQLIGS